MTFLSSYSNYKYCILIVFLIQIGCQQSIYIEQEKDSGNNNNSTKPTNTGVIPNPNKNPGNPNLPIDSNKVPPPTRDDNGKINLRNLTLVGRFDTSNPNFIYFSFINSKVSFRVKNTKRIQVFIEDSADDYFKVYVDGVENNIINTKFSSRAIEYTLVEEMDLNEHTITFIKMTESTKPSNGTDGLSAGRTKLYNFALDPGGIFLSPPSALVNTVQFIGDSSYVGYGLRINRGNCRYSPSNQDGTLSVPARVAQKLNSEVVNISNSGVGIYDSEYDKENKVLDIYQQTVPYLKSPAWSKNDNFRAVFLTAGGNDLIGTPGSGRFPNREGFVSSYTDLVRLIRRKNPRALIVCVVPARAKNTDQTQLREIIQSIVNEFREQGDNKVLYFDFWENTDYKDYDTAAPILGLDYACDYHPGLSGSEYMATQLVNLIKNRW